MSAVDFGALERIERELADIKRSLPELIDRVVRAVLEQRDDDAVGDFKQLAGWLGCASANAARKRVARDPELAALAIPVGAFRRWRRSEVVALLASRRRGGR